MSSRKRARATGPTAANDEDDQDDDEEEPAFSLAAATGGRIGGGAGKKGRKPVQLAQDADAVLAKCRELRDQLRHKAVVAERKQQQQQQLESQLQQKPGLAVPSVSSFSPPPSSGDEEVKDDHDHDGNVVKVSSSSSSKVPPDIVEVVELSSTEVLEGIESVALTIAQQVLSKQGFTLDIPSRASSNQIYVKEWDRIVLGGKRSTRTFLNVRVRRNNCFADASPVSGSFRPVLVQTCFPFTRLLSYLPILLFCYRNLENRPLPCVSCNSFMPS
jgi:hypothetical protein